MKKIFLFVLLIPHILQAMEKTTIVRRSPRLNPGVTLTNSSSAKNADAKKAHERSRQPAVTLDSMPRLKDTIASAVNLERLKKLMGINIPDELTLPMSRQMILSMHQNHVELLASPQIVQAMQQMESDLQIMATPSVSDDKIRSTVQNKDPFNDSLLKFLRSKDPEFMRLEKRVIAHVTPKKCCGLSRLFCWRHKR